ncbi:hypothetical protein M514_05932 [Trichuris suis]|uniref:Protein aurora borealis n=1 Tax=Trichuris suis TaxID=68888 RepID=A0A085N7X1_9BILA|nr:hypothetical protein M513_05932 [Trichuris suis]KFD65567.1 hypothetical protein M514_05932 [Trichuris suis]
MVAFALLTAGTLLRAAPPRGTSKPSKVANLLSFHSSSRFFGVQMDNSPPTSPCSTEMGHRETRTQSTTLSLPKRTWPKNDGCQVPIESLPRRTSSISRVEQENVEKENKQRALRHRENVKLRCVLFRETSKSARAHLDSVDLSDIYNVERMSQMISSPSVLSKTLRVKAKRSDFSWSMEQLSTIQPADINESGNSSNAWSCSTAQESAVQEAIDEFFSDNLIHPSPRLQRSPSDSTPSLSPVQMNNDGIGRSVQCQTLFTFPRNLNFDMFLGEHFRLSDESASSVSNQTMGCRKKLFEQSDSSQFEKSSGSVVDEDVADVAVCIGDLKMSTTESFSSVPSGKCGTDENCVQPLYLSPNETSEAKNKLPSDHIATECFIPIELIDSGNVSAVSSDSPTMSMTELSGSKSQSIQKNEDSGMSSCRGTQFEENMQANASLKYNASA